MDDFERRVLRRKRQVFLDNVPVTRDLLVDMKRRGLLNSDMVEQIKVEKSSVQKVNKLFEFLLSCHMTGAFEALCGLLVQDYAWLVKEVQDEVRLESGNVSIDDDVYREAGMLVHRKFGTSKRISEMDKKDMQDLIALKIQVSKEDWKAELDAVRQELNRYKKICKANETKTRELDGSITKFIKDHGHCLVSKAHGMQTTSDILKYSASDTDLLQQLENRQKFVMKKVVALIKERDLMVEERKRCMKILEVKDEAMPLNDVIQVKLLELPGQLQRSKTELGDKERLLKRWRKKVAELEHELEVKDQKISSLQDELCGVEEKFHAMKMKIRSLEEEQVREIAVSNGPNKLKKSEDEKKNLVTKSSSASKKR